MTHESQAWITPVLGLTKYFLGEVVLTWQKGKCNQNELYDGLYITIAAISLYMSVQ